MKKLFIVGFSFLLFTACTSKPTDNLEMLEGSETFQMSDNVECTILTSTDPTKKGERISLLAAKTAQPKIFWPDKKAFSSLEKLHEGMNLIGLRYVNDDEKFVDTYLLNEKTGLFAVKRVGIALPEDGIVSKGQCE